MSQSYIDVLKSNLTSSEYQTIFKGYGGNDGKIDDIWGGYCYGMLLLWMQLIILFHM